MAEVDPDCVRTALGDPTGDVGEVRDGNVHKCPDGHRQTGLDPASQSRAVGDPHGLRFKLVGSDRRCPVHGNADGLAFVLSQPGWVFGLR